MPQDLNESVTGSTELVFPDDANGTYSLRERSVYDAEEVRLELETDIPKYGSWMPVTIEETGEEAWLTAPSELRSVLVEDEIRAAERFEIVTMQKRGMDQSDPYEVEIRLPDRETTSEDQTSLSSA
jgi:hypothetical protein